MPALTSMVDIPQHGNGQHDPVINSVDATNSSRATDSTINMDSSEKGAFNPRTTGFRTIEVISKITLLLIVRFWRLCTSALLLLLLTCWFYGGLVTFMLFWFAVIGLLYHAQDMLLYYPNQPPNSRLYVDLPSTVNLPYENHFVRTRDGILINVVLIKQSPPICNNCPTVIYFHGNAGNIGHRLMNAHGLYTLCGFNVLLVEYRGYGKSGGSISESGLYKDAEAAMDFAMRQKDLDQNKLIIFGRSLGGAVAIHLASQPYYARFSFALMLENTFTSLPEIGRTIFNVKAIKFVPRWAYKNQYPSKERIKKIKAPVLFISGLADNLIPPRMMQSLYQLSGSCYKRLATFEGGTHNETWMCPEYYNTLREYAGQVYQRRQLPDAERINNEESEFVTINTDDQPGLKTV